MVKYILREMTVKYKGFKKVKTLTIKAPKDIYDWFKSLENEGVEKFLTVYLNTKNEVISFSADFSGGISNCSPDISCILKNALLQEASGIILIHNHPSGSPEPSIEDKTFTNKLKEGCNMVNITLLDHIVIGLDRFISFKTEGLI